MKSKEESLAVSLGYVNECDDYVDLTGIALTREHYIALVPNGKRKLKKTNTHSRLECNSRRYGKSFVLINRTLLKWLM